MAFIAVLLHLEDKIFLPHQPTLNPSFCQLFYLFCHTKFLCFGKLIRTLLGYTAKLFFRVFNMLSYSSSSHSIKFNCTDNSNNVVWMNFWADSLSNSESSSIKDSTPSFLILKTNLLVMLGQIFAQWNWYYSVRNLHIILFHLQ